MRISNKSSLILLMSVAFFFVVQSVSYARPKPPTVYIGWGGKGDFRCDGKADQVQINKALKFVAKNSKFTTVYIKGKHTYWINNPIVIPSNVKLKGDSTAKIQLVNNVDWPGNKPMVRQAGKEHWNDGIGPAIYGTNVDSIKNVEISGFEISGGNQKLPPGKWFVIIMMFYRASNLKIHDMNLNSSCGDIIRIMDNGKPNSKNVKIYKNRMSDSGHEGMYLVRIKNLSVYKNKIFNTRTNAGIRVTDCTNVSIYKNIVGNKYDGNPSGYAGIYVENKGMNLGFAEIYSNFVYGKTVGILLEAVSGGTIKNVSISHNRLFKIAAFPGSDLLHGAIRIIGAQNTTIEYNTIVGSVKDGIIFETGSTGGKLKTIVRRNIISNCGGYGIDNRAPKTHKFILSKNNIYKCKSRSYRNASSKSDSHVNLKFVNIKGSRADKIDLHLKKKAKVGAYGTPAKSKRKKK